MNWRLVLIAISFLAIGFYGGYNTALTGFFGDDVQQINNTPSTQNDDALQAKQFAHHAWLDMKRALRSEISEPILDPILAPDKENTELPSLSNTKDYVWRDPNDIVGMFEELMGLSEPGNDDQVKTFSRAIDQLRNILADSPMQLAILVEHMQTLNFDSKEFHYITAILQGLPEQKGYAALEGAALSISQRNDAQSQQQFLHLVSNTYNGADNPEILSTLVDIALYSDSPASIKLEALDLVMPFQISNVEREQILSGLHIMLESANSADHAALVNHTLRFSTSDDRERMANRFIDPENELELRYSILDGLHSGTVPRSAKLKEQLFNIANDPADPLNQQARHALMYVFDISNQEYQQIKQ